MIKQLEPYGQKKPIVPNEPIVSISEKLHLIATAIFSACVIALIAIESAGISEIREQEFYQSIAGVCSALVGVFLYIWSEYLRTTGQRKLKISGRFAKGLNVLILGLLVYLFYVDV